MPIRLDDPRPPYLQLAAELRRAIVDGEYVPGDRLPSRRRLAHDYGIAETTVVHAIEQLEEEGLVVAQQGRGVFVQDLDAGSDTTEGRPKTLQEELAETLRDLEEANELLDRYRATGIELPEPSPGPERAPEPGVDL